jgi:hypothetical protein
MNGEVLARAKRRAVALAGRAFPLASLRVASARWLLLLVAGGCLLGYAGVGSARNLARGKPIRMSSNCEAPPTYSPISVEPSRLVDGSKSRWYDACTQKERGPWVWIDLQAAAKLDSVVVTGRRDCCWGYADLPLVLELSEDDATFTEVARRELPISDRDPWRVKLAGARGRYVRLRVDAPGAASIVLQEIEVFGSPLTP